MQTDWSVEITAAGSGPGPTDAAIWALLDLLVGRVPVASHGPDRYTVRFCVETDDAAKAVASARKIFGEIVKAAGLPDWPIVHTEASTMEELERENSIPNYPTLLGVKELADLLGVSKQRVWELRNTKGFPQPLTNLASTPVWTESSVQHFLEEWRRKPGRPRKAAAG